MKSYLKILNIILILLLASCDKEPPESLEISSKNIAVSNSNAEEVLNVTSNGKWTASIASTWCTITPTSGDGDGAIIIKATDNTTAEERSVKLTITSRSLTKTATITQGYAILKLDKNQISVEKESTTESLAISSNTRWTIDIPAGLNWVTASALSGDGNKEITFTFTKNSGGQREGYINIRYADTYITLRVVQLRGVNSSPAQPALISPADNLTDANRLPTFRWHSVKDPDGDEVTYKVEYSLDQSSWTGLTTIKDTVYNLSAYLDANTPYYWRVIAADEFGAEGASAIHSLTTGEKTSYFDGEYKVAFGNIKGATPNEILFLGDGYISEDFEEGGLFDQDMDLGIEHFFSIEPYKSYREYFKVYKQAAYSAQSGVKQTDKGIMKVTRFDTDFTGGSSMTTNTELLFDYAKMIPGVDDNKLKNLLIILVVNQNRYAGTCWIWSDGKSIAICPVSKSTSNGTNYRNIVLHEAGGHGFGRLADEYVDPANSGKPITSQRKSDFNSFVKAGFYPNADLTGNWSEVKWKHFIEREGYERVATYEGAFYFTYDVWRPEISSCMIQNEPYYNAPSREFMVKRIFKTAGEEYTLEKFIEKDVEKAPSESVNIQTKSINPLLFVPLAPPVMIK